MPVAILILGVLTIIYTYRGGMKAVVWTEIVQATVYLVGGISAVVLIVIGYLLGGWVVAAGTAVLGIFIFGVALAGTRTTKERVEQRRRKGLAPTMEPTEPAPRVVTHAIEQIEARVGRS
jgi:hypothetical protein